MISREEHAKRERALLEAVRQAATRNDPESRRRIMGRWLDYLRKRDLILPPV